MTNYREILRLQSLGLNKSQIAAACGCSRTTVVRTLNLAAVNGISYPLADGTSDKQLAEILFPSDDQKPVYKMPDYDYVEHEMHKSGVTLNLLWLEYIKSVIRGSIWASCGQRMGNTKKQSSDKADQKGKFR